ncbi:MAG TPA: hypothetical protein VK083_03405 [Nocardia sp.]|uniref:hypothetical protein n=1 Tax=Nocardia TaxID=1817 RepID=UPI00245652DB|nr:MULTISPECIES: hypothetical protein [Nocardia]HLS75826.1 hypothetical protein [Nocardia sp.]
MSDSRRQSSVERTPAPSRRLDAGTVCLAGLIVATLVGGLAVLSASPVVTVAAALGIIAVLAFVVAALL